ncbi:MAG: ATP-binding cassette domain-containing protein, partial [Ruminococcus sp.]|nr:ATP-binding cassette domain-containing protein [Ruminococcus sp.]
DYDQPADPLAEQFLRGLVFQLRNVVRIIQVQIIGAVVQNRLDALIQLHIAQADKFIDALSDRYKTIIGERGLGISGGQKQRVSIARAFLKNAPIFVLDDSTSALDVNTEKTLLKEIRDNFSEKTVIITAHRFSSVVHCDEILYMKDGEIAERGTFEELMQLGGSFAKVYNVQQEQQDRTVDYDSLAEKGGEVRG